MRHTDFEAARAAIDREEAVVRPDVPAPVGAQHDRAAIRADAGIDDAEEDVAARQALRERREQVCGGADGERRRLVQQVDHAHARCMAIEHRLDLAHVEVVGAEIAEKDDGHW